MALPRKFSHLITLKSIFFLFTFFILLATTVSLSVLFFHYAEQFIKNDALAYFKSASYHQLKELKIKLEYIEGLAVTISEDDEIISDIIKFGENDSVEDKYYIQQNLSKKLSIKYSYIEDILNVNILIENSEDLGYQLDNGFFNLNKIADDSVVDRILHFPKGWLSTPVEVQNSYRFIDSSSISYFKRIYESRYDGRGIGYVLVNVNQRYFLDILNTGYDKYATRQFIVNSEGIIIAETNELLIGKPFSEFGFSHLRTSPEDGEILTVDGKNIIYSDSIDRYNWSIWSVTNESTLLRNLKGLRLLVFIISTSILFISSIILFQLTRMITRPIHDIADIMVQFEGPDQIVNKIPLISETKSLYSSYNAMTYRIQSLFDQLKKEEKKKSKAELMALQSQINPHFLYNTLDSINWLALRAGQPVISTLIYKLSRIMRLSLNEGESYYLLVNEIEHVNSYLDIQLIRFNNSFTFTQVIDKSLHNCVILKLLIQPMVENAINHGFDKDRKKENKLKLTIKQLGSDRISIEVIDNGCGMSQEQIERIMMSNYPSRGYGVKNVNERIKLFYGKEFGLRFESEVGKGTKVEIVIPKQRKE
jgi:two-component system sensor histidine kinase YesM